MLSDSIVNHIQIIRGRRVILDSDLAALYGVPTKRLNEQVKRNLDRFPADFMFQLTEIEAENLRSQFATSSLNAVSVLCLQTSLLICPHASQEKPRYNQSRRVHSIR